MTELVQSIALALFLEALNKKSALCAGVAGLAECKPGSAGICRKEPPYNKVRQDS